MKIKYNEYDELINQESYNGKSSVGKTYNNGNNYGKSNKGKKYNKRITAVNDTKSHITKVSVHYNTDNIATCCVAWNSNGDVIECDPTTLPRAVIGFMHNHSKHKRTDVYYRGNKIVMYDVTFCKYIKNNNTVEHVMKRGETQYE